MQTDNIDTPIAGTNLNSRVYAGAELAVLRTHLERLSHDVRMRTQGAGDRVEARSRALAREVVWFSDQAGRVDAETRDYLLRIGARLHRKLGALRTQVRTTMN